jgi:hypothetical protein
MSQRLWWRKRLGELLSLISYQPGFNESVKTGCGGPRVYKGGTRVGGVAVALQRRRYGFIRLPNKRCRVIDP